MKNKTIKKFIQVGLFITTISLFIISSVIYFTRKTQIEYYNVNTEYYDNLSKSDTFINEISKQTGIDSDSIYLIDDSFIKTDNHGNITCLNIDCLAQKDNIMYELQIQSDDNDFDIIMRQLDKVELKINYQFYLKKILNIISCWNQFDNESNDEYFFAFNRDNVKELKYLNNNHQYLFEDNQIVSLKSDLQGEFSLIEINHKDVTETLYYKLK